MSDSKNAPRPLPELRKQIDDVDQRLLKLLEERMQVVAEVAEYKRQAGVQIRDHRRERELIDSRRDSAAQMGLSPEPVEAIYRQIMLASRDYQAHLGAASAADVEHKTVAIIGGKGEMGRALGRLLRELGHELLVVDLDTELGLQEAAERADVVLVSVPIDRTEQVIRQVGPHLGPDALLMDITSVKESPLRWMLEATEASVVGSHPLFGPGVHTFQGQRVVICPGRGEKWCDWLTHTLEAAGLVVSVADPKEHDRAMALVQVLTHYQTQVMGLALSRLSDGLDQARRYTSPTYLLELYVTARHFAQSPDLYGPIEMLNPSTPEVTRAFRDAASELAEVLERQDQERFRQIFEEVRAFFGDFTEEALDQGRFLIDRLVERSMG